MAHEKEYPGIDAFRLVAALLVVTIHTEPLASFGSLGHFVLTRVIARIAVPFFFLASGFFLISRYAPDGAKLRAFEKRTAVIYAAAILLYLPINIYSGDFARTDFLPSFLKDLVFDGTMYHLWYLPAAMLGAAIAWYLVKRLDYGRALFVTGLLYVVGLFGDSYYGLIQNLPAIQGIYAGLFRISDYTRNGIFFAPLFFVLGGYLADSRRRLSWKPAALGTGISLALLLAEALTLNYMAPPMRHDSMYVFLVPWAVFLFQWLLHAQGRRLPQMRTESLLLYILHPLVIVALRPVARILGLWGLLIENSLVHFLAVAALSLALSWGLALLWNRWRARRPKYPTDTGRAWIQLDLENLAHNVQVLQSAMPAGCQLMAVVKDGAYGHGAASIAGQLDRLGVAAFAVATIDEGIALRRCGVRGEILILGHTDVHQARALRSYRLTQTLVSPAYAKALSGQGGKIRAHLKIDTGMHRLGADWRDTEGIAAVFDLPGLRITGMYTHLCCADRLEPADIAFTQAQIDRFYTVVDMLKARGIPLPKLHIQSSYGLLNYPYIHCDYVRCGVALYGVRSTSAPTLRQLDLRPVLSVKARVIHIQHLQAGEGLGYGQAFTAQRESRIAVLAIGYGDGIPRSLSCGAGQVQLGGGWAPVVGRICMDQMMVDVTDLPTVGVGDIATLIAGDGASPISAPFVAEAAGSISNELLCRLGVRLCRTAAENGAPVPAAPPAKISQTVEI